MPDRDAIDLLRERHLERVREAFARALDVLQSFQELAAQNPDDTELQGLTQILCSVMRQLLNTVTCKIASNGMAADWDKLFESECEHGNSDGAGSTDPG